MAILYPDVNIPMVGEDGNAFAILGRVQRLARGAGLPQEKIDEFMAEATGGNYDQLLRTVMKWFTVDGSED